MNKKIIAIILIALLIVNIVAATFIFVDIQVLAFPQTTIQVDVIEINSKEAIIHYDLQLYNPNFFEMILKDFNVVATTPSGEEITNLTIAAGSVPGQSHRSYTVDGRMVMKGNLSDLISSKIRGTIGFILFGIIKKTIPLEITVLISLEEALKKISLPTVKIQAEFGNITRQAVNLSTNINISNPNPFGMLVENINLNITTETGKNVGYFFIPASQIAAKSAVTLQGYGSIIIEALNAKQLLFTLHAKAGVNISGINKSLPFSTQIEITIPNLNEFIPSDKSLELSLDIDSYRERGGLNGNIILEVVNPTKIPFIISDIVVTYYGVKNNQKYFVAEGSLGSGELVPENTTYFHGEMMLYYKKLFNFSAGGFFPEKIFLQLRAKISLPDVNIYIPVAIGSYIDLRLFRTNQ